MMIEPFFAVACMQALCDAVSCGVTEDGYTRKQRNTRRSKEFFPQKVFLKRVLLKDYLYDHYSAPCGLFKRR